MPSLASIFGPSVEGYMATVYPPMQGIDLSIEAISGITGSVSIACWLVVFTPQIIENFRRQSAEGLSLTFLVLWLLGDIFNVLGAILQGVIPTMLILAIYYTFADIVLLIQCFYYRSLSSSKSPSLEPTTNGHHHSGDGPSDHIGPTEDAPLLSRTVSDYGVAHTPQAPERRRSSIRSLAQQAHHLSPANPLHTLPPSPEGSIHKFPYTAPTNGHHTNGHHTNGHHQTNGHHHTNGESSAISSLLASQNGPTSTPSSSNGSTLWTLIYRNTIAVSLVIFAGIAGYSFSSPPHPSDPTDPSTPHHPLEFNLLGQIFGYLCAVLYLGSRIPQIILNYQRKSCEGIAFLFFLFACLGNVTFVISILAYRPGKVEDGEGYWRYIGVNASWLLGSVGTLGLDFLIFVQFFLYRGNEAGSGDSEAVLDD